MSESVQEWRPAGGVIGAPLIADFEDAAKVPLGTVMRGQSKAWGVGEFIYLKGIASTAVGSWVTYDDAFQTALLARDAVGPVAVAMAATVADKFGWYMRVGAGVIGKSADAADSAAVYTSTAPGTVDDAASTGERVWRAIYRSDDDTTTTTTGVASTAYFQIYHPEVVNGLNSGTT